MKDQSTTRACISMAIALWLSACSGSITTAKIADAKADACAKGLRYFKTARVEVRLYRITIPEGVSPGSPLKHRIEIVGDTLSDALPDTGELWELEYHGALFANQTIDLAIGDKGGVKSIGLTSNSGNAPAVLGGLQAIQKGLETQAGFAKTKEQARIDELTRQTNLIKAQNDLAKALGGK